MLTSYQEAYQTPIFLQNQEEDGFVARVVDAVVHPDTGIFEALWVKTPEGLRLLSPQNILSWNKRGIFIDSPNDLVTTEEFPRLQGILKKEISILGSPVWAKDTHKPLGKVINFTFDTLSPRLLSIIVQKGVLFWAHRRIIPQSQILKITPEGIWVQDIVSKPQAEKSVEILKHSLPELDP